MKRVSYRTPQWGRTVPRRRNPDPLAHEPYLPAPMRHIFIPRPSPHRTSSLQSEDIGYGTILAGVHEA